MMKDFINKLQKDLKNLETAIKKDSDELLKKVKTYATKENLNAAGVEIEKVLEHKLKEFEPTLNKVVGEIRKNAAKAGINIDQVEDKVRSTVKKATATMKSVAAKAKQPSPISKVKVSVAKKAKKAKAPSSKAATVGSKNGSKKESKKDSI